MFLSVNSVPLNLYGAQFRFQCVCRQHKPHVTTYSTARPRRQRRARNGSKGFPIIQFNNEQFPQ